MEPGDNHSKLIRILMIEDDEDDVLLIREMLDEIESFKFQLQVKNRLEQGLKLLTADSFDIVLLDLNLPDSSGLINLNRVLSTDSTIPVIVLTGINDETIGIKAVQEGAQDYLIKGQVVSTLLCRSIYYAIERQRSEVALQELNKDLKRSNQDLEDFTYAVSHDLKAPLRKLITYGDFLLEDYSKVLDEDGRLLLQRMQKASFHLRTLIDDLLALSRVGTRGGTFQLLNTNAIIAEVLDLLQFNPGVDKYEYIDSDNNVITTDKLPDIYADPTQMHQLFQNIISNGLKYKKESEPALIHISATDAGDYVTFSVSDNGIGIEEIFLEKVFLIFKRLHTNDHYNGTGVGLALCKKVVERHGGRIWCQSGVGTGSTFHFTLMKLNHG